MNLLVVAGIVIGCIPVFLVLSYGFYVVLVLCPERRRRLSRFQVIAVGLLAVAVAVTYIWAMTIIARLSSPNASGAQHRHMIHAAQIFAITELGFVVLSWLMLPVWFRWSVPGAYYPSFLAIAKKMWLGQDIWRR
jgi:hypothetical protein